MTSRLAKYFQDNTAAAATAVASQESTTETGAEEITNVPSAESLAVAKEFLAAQSGVEDVRVAEQQLSIVSAGVGGFKTALEALNEKGGVAQDAAPLFEKAINVYVASVGMEAISLGFKHDEFNEENPRQCASFEELDNATAMFGVAVEQLVTARNDAEKRLTAAAVNFSPEVVSTESFGEVTAEIGTARQATQADIQQSIVTAAAPLREAMIAGNAAGGFGMESLLAISLGVEAFTQLMGRESIELIGVEELKADGLNQVAMEEFEAACAEVVVVEAPVAIDAGLETTGNAAAAEVTAGEPAKPTAACDPEIVSGEAPEMFDGEGPLSESDVLELLTENDGEYEGGDTVSEEGFKGFFKWISSRKYRMEQAVKGWDTEKAEILATIADLEEKLKKAKAEHRYDDAHELSTELISWQDELHHSEEIIGYFHKELKRIEEKEKVKAAAQAKASTESLEASMEANIKDLKSGKKVKFSHGHGKIVKMFTAPFKYGHKEHHASKDEPRFLVKADKGGHYSIHKASALTLV